MGWMDEIGGWVSKGIAGYQTAQAGYQAGKEASQEIGLGDWLGKKFPDLYNRKGVLGSVIGWGEDLFGGGSPTPTLRGSTGSWNIDAGAGGPVYGPPVPQERFPWARQGDMKGDYGPTNGNWIGKRKPMMYLDEYGNVIVTRRRRMNPLNPRALARAQRRISGFEHFIRRSFTFPGRTMKSKCMFRRKRRRK